MEGAPAFRGDPSELARRLRDPWRMRTQGGTFAGMAAKVSPRVQQLVAEAAALPPDDLAALVEALRSLPHRPATAPERHALIEERVKRVHGGAATLSIEELELRVRSDLDF